MVKFPTFPAIPANVTRAALSRMIRKNAPEILRRSKVVTARFPSGPMSLAGESAKVNNDAKGVDQWLLSVVYLAPADESFAPDSGRTNCPAASTCWRYQEGHRLLRDDSPSRSACLVNSGKMTLDSAKAARGWRTALALGWRDAFWALLGLDVERLQRKAAKEGASVAIRLDGTSDLGLGDAAAERWPSVTFWDYTKVAGRLGRSKASNRHVTYSYDGTPESARIAANYLETGGTVSYVLAVSSKRVTAADRPTSVTLDGRSFPTVSGDDTDARFMDPAGSVNLLSFKSVDGSQLPAAVADGFAQ